MNPMNETVAEAVATAAIAYYQGRYSSVAAYAAIDRVAGSAWHCYPGILNDTRNLFNALVDYLIDFDVDTWA